MEPGTAIRSVDNPGREGVVTKNPARHRPSGIYLQVKWSDGSTDFVHQDELEEIANLDLQDPIGLIKKGRYGRSGDLRRNLTYVHLSGKLANLVYAMGITNTDFYPHQYRPLLTLLDSPVNGILIADEVGLGKTIEAGLIWTELRARFDMRRLLIVCPAVLREKWRFELRNRFGVDAQLVQADELLDALQQPRQQLGDGKAWIISYQAARPPKGWRPGTKSSDRKPGTRALLADYLRDAEEDEPILDMVVFDEAHYMRNHETSAWRLGDLLRSSSTYQVMLSATPINLGNQDLFNLLNLIDPDHFASEDDFVRLLDANKPLVAARDASLNQKSTAEEILGQIKLAAEHPLLAGFSQIKAVLKDPPTDEKLLERGYRAGLADSLEKMSLLSHVVTRTRKRDVEKRRVKRIVKREAVEMTETEQALYLAVTEATRKFAWKRGISDGFLLASPQRQVTSCPAATAAAWVMGGQALREMEEDLGEEYDDEMEGDDSPFSLRELLGFLIPRSIDLNDLRVNDSKFNRLMEVAGEFLKDNPGEKIVVFTTFRATAKYLTDRLNDSGLNARLIWGGQEVTKQEVIDEFRTSTKLRVLVSTEVASEGVDLQFCRVLVNYDLPWNPTRIEQRIGRIDRLGQKAELIHIWNLYFKETIDDRVVNRLLGRLRIFEEALGEAEAIVGEEVRKLEYELLCRPLTTEEEAERIDLAAQALENLRVQRDALEKNAAHMMAHGQRVMERIDAANELSRRVTENDLYIYTQDYLRKFAQGYRFVQEGNDPHVVSVQLPSELASRLDQFMRSKGLLGKSLLASGELRVCRFLNKISDIPRRGEEFIHQFHPLIRFISEDLKARNEHFYPLVSVRIPDSSGIDRLPKGRFAFYVRAWVFRGVREEELLAVSMVDMTSGQELDPDLGDTLLQHARVFGADWPEAAVELEAELVTRTLEDAEMLLDKRFQSTFERKKNENSDRARFQVDSIDRYLERRLPRLQETLHLHISLGRKALSKATQGQINKLQARMNVRRENIREQEKVLPEKHFVCCGVISITG